MSPGFRREPVQRRPAVANVIVDIDEPGGDVKLRDVHDLSGQVSRKVFLHSSDLPCRNCDIADFVDVIRRVDDVTAFQQQVIGGRRGNRRLRRRRLGERQ